MGESETTVWYYDSEDNIPIQLTVPVSPKDVKLKHLKETIVGRGDIPNTTNCKYMFKFRDGSLNYYKDEIINDDANLPFIDGKVYLWLRFVKRSNASTAPSSNSFIPSPCASSDMNRPAELNMSLFPRSRNFPISTTCDVKKIDLRRRTYIYWSNSKTLKNLFKNTIKSIQKHLKLHCLDLDSKGSQDCLPGEDILMKLWKTPLKKTSDENVIRIEVVGTVNDVPLSSHLPVAGSILGINRNVVTSKITCLGKQHVVISNTATDSESSESETIKTASDSEEPQKKKHAQAESELKICQIAKNLNYDKQLDVHKSNSIKIDSTEGTWVDVLIFIESRAVCSGLADYLGLICLEDSLAAEVKAVTLLEMLQNRFENSNAKSYRLLQNVVARKLMFGRSNVCLTSNYFLFSNVKAHTKGLISLQAECETMEYRDRKAWANIEVILRDPVHILHYVTAMTKIVEFTKVLIFVNYDIDAICHAKILQDSIVCTLIPVSTISDLILAYNEHKQDVYSTVRLFYCGGTIDIVEILEPEENVIFFVADSHRPTDVCNVYSSSQIRMLCKSGPEEDVPNLEDIFKDEDEIDDDGNVESQASKHARLDEQTVMKRREKRIWEENRKRILFEHVQFSYYSCSCSILMYELSWQIHRDNVDLLCADHLAPVFPKSLVFFRWGIVGVVEQFILGKVEILQNLEEIERISAHVGRLCPHVILDLFRTGHKFL